MFSTTWRFNVSANFFHHHVALQCEHTFFSPPRGASDHPLVFFSIAAVTVALGVRVVDMTSSGRAGYKYV